MGLKYYLNLIKKESDIEAVKLRYFLNTFLFMVYMILLVMFFSLKNTNAVLSGVCGMVGLLFLLQKYIMDNRFQKFIANIIQNEVLDENDIIDAAFITYHKGFLEEKNKNAVADKILLIAQIIISSLFIASLQLSIVLNVTGNLDLSNQIFRVVDIMLCAFIILIIIFGVFWGMKNGVWYQDYIKELDIIKNYKAKQQGISGKPLKRKYKILEDKKPKDQLKYLFNNASLLKKFTRLQKTGSIGGVILGVLLGVSLIIPSSIFQDNGLSETDAGFYSGIIIAAMFCLTVIFAVNTYAINKIIKAQYKLLKENKAENHLHIKLHDLRTPFYKRWNIIFLLGFVGAIFSNIALGSIVATLANTDDYSWIFFLLIIVEIITMFVMYFKAFSKLRFRMMAIEKEIYKQREIEN